MKKLVNVVDMESMVAEAFVHFLHDRNIEFKSKVCHDKVHFEVCVTNETKKVINEFIDVLIALHEYFKSDNNGLQSYVKLEYVTRKSSYVDDDYLYMVVALRADGYYAVWTSWNMDTKVLNHGNYLLTKNMAYNIIKKYKH